MVFSTGWTLSLCSTVSRQCLGEGESLRRVPPVSGDAQEVTQELVHFPVNSGQTSPGLWPPGVGGCPCSAWLAFSPGRLLAIQGPLGMRSWTRCLAHPLCQETVCHPAWSVVGLREQNQAWGLVGAGLNYSVSQMWLPRGQRWVTQAHVPPAVLADLPLCAPGQVTHTSIPPPWTSAPSEHC